MQSKGDDLSPMNGHDLIAAKVKTVVWMDGSYNFGCAHADNNWYLGSDNGCHGSAQIALNQWPSNVK